MAIEAKWNAIVEAIVATVAWLPYVVGLHFGSAEFVTKTTMPTASHECIFDYFRWKLLTFHANSLRDETKRRQAAALQSTACEQAVPPGRLTLP